jgi:hypothetical protein
MLILGVIGGLLALAAGPVAAQSGGYDLSWSTVDGGGGESAAGDFRVVGSAGQPDAGSVSGGARRLGGGFWGGGAASEAHRIYLPLVLR